jgi:hypothetical protein
MPARRVLATSSVASAGFLCLTVAATPAFADGVGRPRAVAPEPAPYPVYVVASSRTTTQTARAIMGTPAPMPTGWTSPQADVVRSDRGSAGVVASSGSARVITSPSAYAARVLAAQQDGSDDALPPEDSSNSSGRTYTATISRGYQAQWPSDTSGSYYQPAQSYSYSQTYVTGTYHYPPRYYPQPMYSYRSYRCSYPRVVVVYPPPLPVCVPRPVYYPPPCPIGSGVSIQIRF